MNCWITLQSPDPRAYDQFKTIPADDRRSLAGLRSRGWAVVRIFRATLPWPARQLLQSCVGGHPELTR